MSGTSWISITPPRTSRRDAQRAFAEAEETTARRQIEDAGCEVIELTEMERQAFQAAVQPVYRETQDAFGGKTVAEILGAR